MPTTKKKKKKTLTKSARKTTEETQEVIGARRRIDSGFELNGTNGEIRLSDLRGKKIVLYFYPKDATPGCTIEGHDFSRLLERLSRRRRRSFRSFARYTRSHEKFRAKENYTVHLLSDTEENACSRFDVVKMKNMYGKKVRGIERSTFVIDEDGKLVKEWRKVSVDGPRRRSS